MFYENLLTLTENIPKIKMKEPPKTAKSTLAQSKRTKKKISHNRIYKLYLLNTSPEEQCKCSELTLTICNRYANLLFHYIQPTSLSALITSVCRYGGCVFNFYFYVCVLCCHCNPCLQTKCP